MNLSCFLKLGKVPEAGTLNMGKSKLLLKLLLIYQKLKSIPAFGPTIINLGLILKIYSNTQRLLHMD